MALPFEVTTKLLAGGCLLFIGLLMHTVGLATTNWTMVSSGYVRFGLWEACRDSDPECLKFEPDAKHISCDAFAILGMVMGLIAFICAALFVILPAVGRPRNDKLPLISMILASIAFACVLVCVIVYATAIHSEIKSLYSQSDTDISYGDSFGVSIAGGILMAIGGVLILSGKRPQEAPGGGKPFKIALGVLFTGLLVHIMGTVTPEWSVHYGGDDNYKVLGLWKVCGSSDCDPLTERIAHAEACQTFAIIGVLLGVLALVLGVLIFLLPSLGKSSHPKFPQFMMGSAVAALVSVLICIILWGAAVHEKISEAHHIGYSFGLSLIGGIIMASGGVRAYEVGFRPTRSERLLASENGEVEDSSGVVLASVGGEQGGLARRMHGAEGGGQ